MICQQTCATMGVCTCGQREAHKQADPVSKLEDEFYIQNKQNPKVVVISTPSEKSHFHQLIVEERG